MNDFCIQMLLQLISISGCDSKSRKITGRPFREAKIKGVSLNIGIEFRK